MYSSISFATLTVIASVVSAASQSFGVMNTASGTDLQYSSWGVANGKITVGGTSTSFVVQDNTSVKTADGKYFKVNSDNSISLTDSASDATTGFTIGTQDGSLVPFYYKGSNSYAACATDSSSYVMYIENDNDSACTGVSGYAVSTDGSTISPFTGSGYQNGTSTTATTANIATTVVTVTSCSSNVCTTAPVTTGVTVVTSTVGGTKTVYTTYCPLTASTSVPPASQATTAKTSSVAKTSSAAAKSASTSVIPASQATTAKTSATASTSVVPATQFTGAANIVNGGSVAALGAIAFAALI